MRRASNLNDKMGMHKILVEAGWVIPEAKAAAVIRHGAVAIEGNRIVHVGVASEVRKHFVADQVISLRGSAVLPGLINTHTHLVGGFNKGITEDISGTAAGLFRRARPLQEKYVKPEYIYYPGFVHGMEMLMTGTTTINETWYYQIEAAKIVRDLGIRAVIAEMVREGTAQSPGSLERVWDRSLAEHGFDKSVELIEQFHNFDNGRITCRIAPHAPDSMREWALVKCRDMARQYDLGLHIHLAQVPGETEYMLATHGKRPVHYMKDMGLLGERTIGIHCVFLDPTDIEMMAETKTAMSHTAYLVAKRAYFPPMPQVYASGMRVSFGSDWCSNDMWKIMRTAILFARVLSGKVETMSGYDALRIATIDGARALNMENEIGTLTVGKKADLIAVDMQTAWCQPVRDADVITTLVYNANGSDVTHVIVDGKVVVADRRLATADQDAAFREAQKMADRVWKDAAEIFV